MRWLAEWLRPWWVTYVQMSRRERRALIAIINDPDAEYVDAPRPEASP